MEEQRQPPARQEPRGFERRSRKLSVFASLDGGPHSVFSGMRFAQVVVGAQNGSGLERMFLCMMGLCAYTHTRYAS